MEEEQEQINYADVIALGFTRQDISDTVFESQYGYIWFLVTKELTKNIRAEWDCNDRTVEIVRYDKDSNILGKMPLQDLSVLKTFINFYSPNP